MSIKYTRVPICEADVKEEPVFDYSSPFQYEDASFTSKYKSIFKFKSLSKPFSHSSTDMQPEFGTSVFVTTFTLFSYLLLFVTAPISLWFCIKIIAKHERLLVFRLGRVHSVRGPGCIILLPCIERWQRIDIRPRAFNIPPQQLITDDGAIVELGADVQFRVVNVYDSVLHVQNLDQTFRMFSRNLFICRLCKKSLNQLQQQRPFISQELVDSFNEITMEWGIKVEHIELSHMTVLKQSEPSSLLKNFLSSCQVLPQQSTSTVTDKQAIPLKKDSTIRNMLNSFAKASSGLGIGDTESAVFKLEVLGEDVETFYVRFDRNEISVLDDGNVCPKPDVSIRISQEDIIRIFDRDLSPLHAYVGGLIQIEGNVQLLMKFEMAMQSLPKQLSRSVVIDV